MFLAKRKSDGKIMNDIQTGKIKLKNIVSQFGGEISDYELIEVPKDIQSQALACNIESSRYNKETKQWTFQKKQHYLLKVTSDLIMSNIHKAYLAETQFDLNVSRHIEGESLAIGDGPVWIIPSSPVKVSSMQKELVNGKTSFTITPEEGKTGIISFNITNGKESASVSVFIHE